MKITSKSFKDNTFMDEKFTAYGKNIFPHLKWDEVPKQTKSFALFMHDSDAPIVSGFWHLQIVDIDPDTREIQENKLDEIKGFIRNNDTDEANYFGPQPPVGDGIHKYSFKIYALPFKKLGEIMKQNGLNHSKTSSRAYAAFFVEQNKLDYAEIIGIFEKN